jgi:hypothetical protein
MPQRRADGRQRYPLPKEVHGEGMAQRVASQGWDRQATEGDAAFKYVMHRRRSERPRWRSAAQEEFPAGAGRATTAQVSRQDGAALRGERQHKGLLGLRLPNRQGSGSPIDVVQRQADQLAAPQPVARRQVQEREIPQAAWV